MDKILLGLSCLSYLSYVSYLSYLSYLSHLSYLSYLFSLSNLSYLSYFSYLSFPRNTSVDKISPDSSQWSKQGWRRGQQYWHLKKILIIKTNDTFTRTIKRFWLKWNFNYFILYLSLSLAFRIEFTHVLNLLNTIDQGFPTFLFLLTTKGARTISRTTQRYFHLFVYHQIILLGQKYYANAINKVFAYHLQTVHVPQVGNPCHRSNRIR